MTRRSSSGEDKLANVLPATAESDDSAGARRTLRRDPDSIRLLGRESEVNEIHDLLRHTSQSGTGILLLEGTHGIGKTALLNTACQLGAAAGARVFRARAGEQEQTRSLGIAHQIVAQLNAKMPAPASREMLRRTGPTPRTTQALLDLYEELDAALVDHATNGHIVVAVDDLHWADPASIGWLQYLAHRLGARPITIILTAIPPSHTLHEQVLDPLRVDSMTRRLTLRPLTAEATIRLVTDRFGDRLDAEKIGGMCHLVTKGNPKLLFALLDDLAQTEPLPDGDELIAHITHSSPCQVVRATVHRARTTGDASVSVIRAVSLADGLLTSTQVADLVGLEAAGLETSVERLADAGILERTEPLRFVHPLVRSAIAAAISPATRRRLHRLSAELLRMQGAPEAEIASLLLETVPGGDLPSAQNLTSAGHQALDDGRISDATAFLARAVTEVDLEIVPTSFVLDIARLEARLGDPKALDHLGSVTLSEVDITQVVEILFSMAHGRGTMLLPSALNFVRQFLSSAHEGAGTLVDTLEVAVAMLAAPAQRGQDLARIRNTSTRSPLIRAVDAMCLVDNPIDAAAAPISESLREAVTPDLIRSKDPVAVQIAARSVIAQIRMGRLDIAEQIIATATSEDAHEAAIGQDFARLNALIAIRRGDVESARALCPPVGSTVQTVLENFHTITAQSEARLHVLDGDGDLAWARLDAIDPTDRDLDRFVIPETRGWLSLIDGHVEDARDEFLAAGRIATEAGITNPAVSAWRTGAARALHRIGVERGSRELFAQAADLATEAVVLARSFGVPGTLAQSLAGLASTRSEGRVELLAEADSLADDVDDVLLATFVKLELSRALRRANRPTQAIEVLRDAGDLIHHLDSSPLAQAVKRELWASGVRPHRLARTGPVSLTPAQLRVARLAAEGATNSEIAATLYVTIKTVESHLAQAFKKLSVSSRLELHDAIG